MYEPTVVTAPTPVRRPKPLSAMPVYMGPGDTIVRALLIVDVDRETSSMRRFHQRRFPLHTSVGFGDEWERLHFAIGTELACDVGAVLTIHTEEGTTTYLCVDAVEFAAAYAEPEPEP